MSLKWEKMTSFVGVVKSKSAFKSLKKLDELINVFSFLKKGQRILVKANINTSHKYPGNTEPQFLGELVKLLYEAGAGEVIVGDMSTFIFAKRTRENMRKIGVENYAIDAGAKVLAFNEFGEDNWINIKHPMASHWSDGFRIPKIIQIVDCIVNLSMIKTHLLAGYTGALKNVVGIISVKDRLKLHVARRIGVQIAELNLGWEPSINILDCRKVFVTGGPFSGKQREPSLVIASSDRISCDVVGLAVLKMLGTTSQIQNKSAWKQPQIKRAVELGLGAKSCSEICIKSFGVEEIDEIEKNMI